MGRPHGRTHTRLNHGIIDPSDTENEATFDAIKNRLR